jgi:hypothetical protein
MDVTNAMRPKGLDEENRKLKQLALDNQDLRFLAHKKS